MILLLPLIALSHVALAVYFGWRFWLHRRLPSLLCAVLPIGWVLFVANVAGWMSDSIAGELMPLGLALGVFGVATITVFEANQPNPFR